MKRTSHSTLRIYNGRSSLKIIFFTLASVMLVASMYLLTSSEKLVSELRDEEVEVNIENFPTGEEDVLAIDQTIFTDEVVKNRIQETNPNVFIAHLDDAGPNINWTCGLYVSALDIKYNNIYWQEQQSINEKYLLYGAYYDNRPLAGGPVVRVLGMADKLNPPDDVYCLMWFGDEPVITKIFQKLYMWQDYWGYNKEPLQPYLWSCKIPTEYGDRVPDSVSFLGQPCERATNNLRVIYNPPLNGKKKNFVVCVKALNFKHNANLAVRLIEWIELLKILGADKIVFHEFQVHDNTTKVLDYYKQNWNVDVIKTSMPGFFANIPDFMSTYLRKRLGYQIFQDMMQYNDCFYRNVHQYRYVVLHDVDEVIVPKGKIRTWQELLYSITLPNAIASKNVTYASFIGRNVHYVDDKKEVNDWYVEIPRYMHMLQHVLRNAVYVPPGEGIKAFHNTDVILSLHNHFARACIGNDDLWCEIFDFDLNHAHLQHYCLGRNKPECMTLRSGNLTLDTNLWKYKDQMIRAVRTVLKRTGFLKSSLSLIR